MNIISLTGAGLKRLRELKRLQDLDIEGVEIKGEIPDGLIAAIPGLRIQAKRINDGTPAGTPTPVAPRN